MYQPRNHLANEHKWWLWHFNGDIIYAKLIEEWLYHCSLQKNMMVDENYVEKKNDVDVEKITRVDIWIFLSCGKAF